MAAIVSELTRKGMALPQGGRTNYLGQNIDQPGGVPQQQGQQPVTPQFDINALMAAFLQQQAQTNIDRTQLQRERSFGRHIGWQGPGGLTPQAKWDEMFGQNSASKLSPEARLASQGASAMNQWGQLGQVDGVDAGKLQGLMGQKYVNPEATFRSNPGNVIPEPPDMTPGPNPTTRQIPGGYEGMINPQMQGNAKFADANMFTVRPGSAPNVPEGAYGMDENGPMYRPGQKTKKRSGKSFGFDATAARGFSM